MVKSLNTHIAYLLTKHGCLVIPGFGAFVVSSAHARKKEIEGVLLPPSQTLGFNAEIKHNDGILSNFLSVMENISYNEADSIVKQYVNQLIERLYTAKTATIPWVGTLSFSSEDKLIFTPDVRLSCNASHFGLSNFYLPCLKELIAPQPVSDGGGTITISLNRKILKWTGSAAAVLLALFLSSAPLGNDSGRYMHNASFFPVSYTSAPEPAINERADIQIQDTPAVVDNEPSVLVEEPQIPEKPRDTGRYYIVIASFTAKNIAEEKLPEFRKSGFPSASVISKEGRHRIYIKRFEEKTAAESYLNVFRRDNPQYSDAWMLAQKTNE